MNSVNGKDPSIVRKLQAAMESTAPNTLAGMKQPKVNTGRQHKYPAGGNTPGTIGVSAIAPVPTPVPESTSKGSKGQRGQSKALSGGIIDRLLSAGVGPHDVATMMAEEKPKSLHDLAVQYPHHVQMEAAAMANTNANKRGKHHHNHQQHHHHHHHHHHNQHLPQQIPQQMNPLEKKIGELEKELLNLKAVASVSGPANLLNFQQQQLQQQQQQQQQQQRVAQPSASPLLAGLTQAKSLQPSLPNTSALGVGGLGVCD